MRLAKLVRKVCFRPEADMRSARLKQISDGGCAGDSGKGALVKRVLLAIALGFAGSAILLAAPFFWASDSLWLTRLAYWPGDRLFEWLSWHHRAGTGEGGHHAIVLIASLVLWWGFGGVVAYAGIGRSRPD